MSTKEDTQVFIESIDRNNIRNFSMYVEKHNINELFFIGNKYLTIKRNNEYTKENKLFNIALQFEVKEDIAILFNIINDNLNDLEVEKINEYQLQIAVNNCFNNLEKFMYNIKGRK